MITRDVWKDLVKIKIQLEILETGKGDISDEEIEKRASELHEEYLRVEKERFNFLNYEVAINTKKFGIMVNTLNTL